MRALCEKRTKFKSLLTENLDIVAHISQDNTEWQMFGLFVKQSYHKTSEDLKYLRKSPIDNFYRVLRLFKPWDLQL